MTIQKKAFSAAELIIGIVILAFVSTTLLRVLNVNHEHVQKIKFQNALTSFKMALEYVLINPLYYSSSADLSDVSLINIDDETFGGDTKFRELVLKELGIDFRGRFECEILEGDNVGVSGNCYKQDNGTIWGIPNTDFSTLNLKQAQNSLGSVSNYLPVTIYVDPEVIQKTDYFEQNAILLGVRSDGVLTVLNTIDCDKEENQAALQCHTKDYLTITNKR